MKKEIKLKTIRIPQETYDEIQKIKIKLGMSFTDFIKYTIKNLLDTPAYNKEAK